MPYYVHVYHQYSNMNIIDTAAPNETWEQTSKISIDSSRLSHYYPRSLVKYARYATRTAVQRAEAAALRRGDINAANARAMLSWLYSNNNVFITERLQLQRVVSSQYNSNLFMGC